MLKQGYKKIDNLCLLPMNAIIQICPICGKVDVYKNDNHDCMTHILNKESQDYNYNSKKEGV